MENLKFIEFWKTGENPITCYISRPTISLEPDISYRRTKNSRPAKQSVTTIDKDGKKEVHESVVEAANALHLKKSTLYAVLNGKQSNPTTYQIFKSTLNN